ncbi:serine/threonine-protein kinase [Blastococcus goldschmidtiae]|uniref:non-specific serine/threonine protein kinase n=1 Tax=Blastococcus goldschmidtiae TaxID=3075546 RepID=A0ABU2K200_9ACTN|nr:serine/threonine protein kinase [Blastococcus sp. DSM 46792]MDT0274378.1 serine/threonine protein kinase [Blastococcus sp. DSM 46792]
MTLATGSLLAGRYEITAPIAVGGMGEVWKARDQVLDRVVAAKVLKSEYTDDPSFLARFRNEARHTAALSHPNIASVYDYGETVDDTGTKKLAFLVMEFVEGQPLVTILHEEGRLPVDWTLHVLEQSAEGLSAAHRAGVVHRDIKPGNLMVRPDGVVKLTDFGIAQARDATPLTRTGMVVGTAQYLSPEQAQGMEVNASSDVYSLGVVAYECLTGGRPFDGTSQVAIALAHINRPPPPLPAEVPPAVRLLVERALAKDPADRFPDGGAFADAVRRVAAGGTLAPVGPATAPTQVVGGGFADGRTTVLAAQTGALTGTRALSPTTGPAAMPPLHGPADDDDWRAHDDGPAPARRRRWAWLLVALVVLLLVGGGTALLINQGGGTDGGRTATPTGTTSDTTAPAAGVVIGPASAYIGEDADDVAAELEGLDLVVQRASADDATLAELGMDLDENAVAAITPAGRTVPAGSTVVLTVAEDGWTVEGEEEPQPQEEPEQSAPAPAPEPEPEPEPTVEPTPTAQPTTDAPTPTPSPTPSTEPSTTATTLPGQPGDEETPTATPTSSDVGADPPEAAAAEVTG